jgi:hypothetical protein
VSNKEATARIKINKLLEAAGYFSQKDIEVCLGFLSM